MYRILVVNPLVYSTKVAIFENEQNLFETEVPFQMRKEYHFIQDQLTERKQDVIQSVEEIGLDLSKIDAVCGRGGLLKPISGGTYVVNSKMIQDLRSANYGEHVSNLGALIAHEIAQQLNVSAYIVDPVVVDELADLARKTGLPSIERKSIFHALNQKSMARQVANDLGGDYHEMNFIVAHLGGGVTVGAHRYGRVVDVNNGFDGEGPFSLERAGSLPNHGLVDLMDEYGNDKQKVLEKVIYQSGIQAYLGTNRVKDVIEQLEINRDDTAPVIELLAYQVAKEIGKLSPVLYGNVQAIVLTGNLSYIPLLTELISHRVSWIADVYEYPGENVLMALAQGTLRVLRNQEKPKKYDE
ncbi:butyrate kinase [Gracilibacillus halophilus YIM-C55.5]|uniref:Probable butyrate kinase n=1 Tax=Gracilibacillus halophilus YIM-C55.5 TaxID=1308866 RepID=N4WSR4_9BACI|nr:butyrate kinase [Gracilibacillus halophilus]ENH97415.1 butyrate kinase [Gracilibacillus halophilus YIM-C55.5]